MDESEPITPNDVMGEFNHLMSEWWERVKDEPNAEDLLNPAMQSCCYWAAKFTIMSLVSNSPDLVSNNPDEANDEEQVERIAAWMEREASVLEQRLKDAIFRRVNAGPTTDP